MYKNILKDDEDILVDNEEEMDVKEELEIKQDSTKEYLGKLQYKVDFCKGRGDVLEPFWQITYLPKPF